MASRPCPSRAFTPFLYPLRNRNTPCLLASPAVDVDGVECRLPEARGVSVVGVVAHEANVARLLGALHLRRGKIKATGQEALTGSLKVRAKAEFGIRNEAASQETTDLPEGEAQRQREREGLRGEGHRWRQATKWGCSWGHGGRG